MKLEMFVLAVGVLAASFGLALADQPGADWLTIGQVAKKLQDSGYSSISKIEADDGHWEGEGMKAGRKMEFRADPRSGVITSEKPD